MPAWILNYSWFNLSDTLRSYQRVMHMEVCFKKASGLEAYR